MEVVNILANSYIFASFNTMMHVIVNIFIIVWSVNNFHWRFGTFRIHCFKRWTDNLPSVTFGPTFAFRSALWQNINDNCLIYFSICRDWNKINFILSNESTIKFSAHVAATKWNYIIYIYVIIELIYIYIFYIFGKTNH